MVSNLTATRLREVLDYNPETGVFVWKVRSADRVHIGDVAGGRDDRGYWRIRVDGPRYRAHRLAWLYQTGSWPDGLIDHKDADPSNNRWDNLRVATGSQNIANSKTRSDNKSGFKGVTWHRACRKWVSALSVNGEARYLGLFDTPEAAHAAYVAEATKAFGSFARGA